jgi:hypothetical protein
MATAARGPATPTTTDPVERWLARRSACPQLDADQLDAKMIGSPAPSLPATYAKSSATYSKAQRARRAGAAEECRAATNRANSLHSTGPRTEPGKQRSSLTRCAPVSPPASPSYLPRTPKPTSRHIQQFLDEYQPATPTKTQLVHEIANSAWRLNRFPLLEAELFSPNPNPQTLIPQLATLGLHGSRLSRQFQKALENLAMGPSLPAVHLSVGNWVLVKTSPAPDS